MLGNIQRLTWDTQKSFVFLPELISSCGKYGSILIPDGPAITHTTSISTDLEDWTYGGGWIVSNLKILMLLFVYAIVVFFLNLFTMGLFALVRMKSSKRHVDNSTDSFTPKQHAYDSTDSSKCRDMEVYFVLALISAIGTLYCTAKMWQEWSIMQEIIGPQNQDSQWGFGQFLSVLI